MNKENSEAAGELSAEQRARISRNFRAAKALLDRKRHRDNENHFDSAHQKIGVARRVETPVPVGGIKRNPLSDISVNTPSPYPVRSFKLTDSGGCNSNSLPKSHGNFVPRTKVVSNENGIVRSSFTTPIRQIDYGADPGFRGLSAQGIESICGGVGAVDEDNKLFSGLFRTPVTPSGLNGRFRNIGSVCSVKASDEDKLVLDSLRTPITPPVCNGSLEQGIAVKNVELRNDGVKDPDGDKLEFDLFRTPVAPSDRDGNLSEQITVRKFEAIYDGLNENKMGVLLAEGVGLSLCNTPGRLHDGSSSIEFTVMPDNFYEDFDDSILGEIDTLCKAERKQNVAGRSSQCNSNDATKSECTEKSNGEDKTNIDAVVFEEMLQTDGVMDLSDAGECAEGGRQSSETSEIENMPAEYAKYMQSLNDRQREAACSDISVPLMIVAGPGSGKTSTMVGRVLKLLNEGIGPSHILAMTFTTAAASEMRDRIGAVAGKAKAKELMISTFHSFCLQLCRSHAEKLGRTPEFLLYGQGQQRRAVIEAVRLTENGKSRPNCDSSKPGEEPDAKSNCPQDFKDKSKKWLKFVSQAKASGKNLEKIQKLGDDTGAAILRNYESILKSCNALDYHDLISCSVKLLTDFPEVLEECQESWKAIVIDEFQDTSAMQYVLLRILATHNRITIVGDEDQSIFSFNGADVSGFNSFRKDFQVYKEIRLNKNYRSTRCIVEAASSLIKNNSKRCQLKNVLTDNSSGSKITLKECCNEDAQCAFVVDKILEITSASSSDPGKFGEIAILYRRQVSGKMFQTVFRNRKIPFNIHGVAFYRKKVVRAIMSMLRTTLQGCDDGSFRRVFKALLPLDKEEKTRVIEHIDKVSTIRKCNFISAATDIFSAKISGTFKRGQLTQGRKVLLTLDMISKLVHREQSLSAVVTSVANMIPQRYLLEQRAVLDVDGGKLLNEDNDLRSVLHYLLDDVSEFLKLHDFEMEGQKDTKVEEKGCVHILKAFIDYISERETENFRSRRHDNTHSVTLTTIHQSKGLEWDTVFIVKANESEIPLLHEFNGITIENCSSVEEERRLLYVAMTRARKKLFILYILMDSNWQVLQPSRFLKEIPKHLLDVQDASIPETLRTKKEEPLEKTPGIIGGLPRVTEAVSDDTISNGLDEESIESSELIWACNGNDFLKRFITEERAVVSHLFHQWAKKAAFKEPKRLLDKVSFVIDERLRAKKSTHKDVLRSLKSCLRSDEAFQYAESVLRWEQIPADKRAYLTREKQEHFQKLRIESAMGSSAPTSKQLAYLQNLGCTTVPTSRLHASRLIEQYKSL